MNSDPVARPHLRRPVKTERASLPCRTVGVLPQYPKSCPGDIRRDAALPPRHGQTPKPFDVCIVHKTGALRSEASAPRRCIAIKRCYRLPRIFSSADAVAVADLRRNARPIYPGFSGRFRRNPHTIIEQAGFGEQERTCADRTDARAATVVGGNPAHEGRGNSRPGQARHLQTAYFKLTHYRFFVPVCSRC